MVVRRPDTQKVGGQPHFRLVVYPWTSTFVFIKSSIGWHLRKMADNMKLLLHGCPSDTFFIFLIPNTTESYDIAWRNPITKKARLPVGSKSNFAWHVQILHLSIIYMITSLRRVRRTGIMNGLTHDSPEAARVSSVITGCLVVLYDTTDLKKNVTKRHNDEYRNLIQWFF